MTSEPVAAVRGDAWGGLGFAPRRLAAVPGVSLWLWHLGGEAAVAGSMLSPAEQARAARFHFERDRRRFVAAHVGLRLLLAQATGLQAAALRFGEGVHGKPYLLDAPQWCFNLSHSADVAVLAVREGAAVGVDVECARPVADLPALAEQLYTGRERRALAAASGEAQARAFLRIWTRKEACMKAVGAGFFLPPQSFHCGAEPAPRRVKVAGKAGPVALTVHSLPAEQGAEIALALAPAGALTA